MIKGNSIFSLKVNFVMLKHPTNIHKVYPQNRTELFFPGAASSFGLLLLHCGGLLSCGGHPLGRHRRLCLGPGDLPALVLAAAGPVPLPVTRVGQLLAET